MPLFHVTVRKHTHTGRYYHHRRCADVWLYSLLHCELAEGHDGPHMATASGYRRPARWVRDDRGLAHALPEPAGPRPAWIEEGRRRPASFGHLAPAVA